MAKKEALFMKTAAALRKNDMDKIVAMQKYVATKQLQAQKTPEIARKEAQGALIRTGVMTKKGNPKKVIVSWE